MEQISVESSHIKSIRYDDEAELLHVAFTQGEKGFYSNVPPETFNTLKDIIAKKESVGKWLNANLRGNPVHPFTRFQPAGNGYVDVSHKVTSANPIDPNTPQGLCPACQTPAEGFEPPIQDERYTRMLQVLKATFELKTDEEAHIQYLKREGGYIQECRCGNSFWVPFLKARVKKAE